MSGLCLPEDIKRLPTTCSDQVDNLLSLQVQTGQALVHFSTDLVKAKGLKKEAFLKEKERAERYQAILVQMKSDKEGLKLRAERAEADRAKSEGCFREAVAELDRVREEHKKELEATDEKAFDEGQQDAIDSLTPQVQVAMVRGRFQGMHRGFSLDYRRALTAVGVPETSEHWALPPTPAYDPSLPPVNVPVPEITIEDEPEEGEEEQPLSEGGGAGTEVVPDSAEGPSEQQSQS